MSNEHMQRRVDETHKADWHGTAAAGSLVSLILPILSEFEGVGEDFMMGVVSRFKDGFFGSDRIQKTVCEICKKSKRSLCKLYLNQGLYLKSNRTLCISY